MAIYLYVTLFIQINYKNLYINFEKSKFPSISTIFDFLRLYVFKKGIFSSGFDNP